MERRYQTRLNELLADAEIRPGFLSGTLSRLTTFLEPFVQSLFAAQRTNAHHYVQGLLSDLSSKDVESIAYLHDRDRQGLQKFIGQANWDYQPLRTELARQVGAELGQTDGVLVLDPSAFPKQGTHSVGVQRQWCGRLGKVDNCQVGIYLGYVSRQGHALVDGRLYLPAEWTRDRKRRKQVGVPTDVSFRTRHQLALDLLEEHSSRRPHQWVAGDDEMGRSSWFRQELRNCGEAYLLAVPANTLVRDLVVPDPPSSGRGRRRKTPFVRADVWCAAVPESAWETVEVRDGEKGPLVVQGAWTVVQAKTEGKASAVVESLVVFREEQSDGTYKHDYLLSASIPDHPVAEFARVYKAEHRIEECLKQAKSEAGLGDYQVRTWEGWQHHQTLALLATWFLTKETRRGKNTDRSGDCAPGADTDSRIVEPRVGGPSCRTYSPYDTTSFAPQRASAALPLATTQTIATASL
jgi:SRSO17 transposase